MSIPLIKENKTSSVKNNLSNSTESKYGLTSEEVANTIKKILSGAQDIKHQKSHRGIFHNIPP
ncbi:12569_t:CDS:1, partial [Acaulospora colombiana]